MIYLYVFLVFVYQSLASSSQCPDLVPGPYMTLSHTEGYIGDPAVRAECEEGHAFNTGQLIKFISCTNVTSGNEWAPAWNDSLGACLIKKCPLITAILSDNMTASDYSPVSEFGDNATVTCSHGYAFDIDTAAPMESRVTSSINVTCEDDPTSTTAVWGDIGMCTEIECEPPYDVVNANMSSSTTTLGSHVIYECFSGYRFVIGIYSIIATCNSFAAWDVNIGPGWVLGVNVQCTKCDAYVGCLAPGSMDVLENATSVIGTTDCRSYCKSNNYRYASLQSDSCSCGDFLTANYTTLSDEACGDHCVDYTVNSTSVPVFCGGSGGATSVYSSLAGCYKDLDVTTPGEPIKESLDVTCSEHCRGKDEAIAAVHLATCLCFNTTNIQGTEVDSVRCKQAQNSNATTSEFTMVYDLGKTEVVAKTCDELFDLGVRMHGYYYLQEPYRRQFCYFKDGTECESGWLGFQGNCYLFGAGSLMNFTDARQFCIDNEAELPSITTMEEHDFLVDTRTLFQDMQFDDTVTIFWWLGLFDSKGTKLYSWVDGNIIRYTNFANGHPAGDKESQCIVELSLSSWRSSTCDFNANVFCKKPQGRSECKVLDNDPSATYSYAGDQMTLTYCMEKCKGKNRTYSILQNDTCWCVDNVPEHTNVSMSNCMVPCPGDPAQHCGGTGTHYRMLYLTGRVMAKSCEDLQILGIGNDTFLTSPDNHLPILEFCVAPKCPYSWVSIGDHCYKFYPIATVDVAMERCTENDAYITMLDNRNELNILISTATNISMYSGQTAWRIGLQSLSSDGVEMRWPNGHLYREEVWNSTFQSMEGPEVLIQINTSDWTTGEFTEQAFICESGQDYAGCYNLSDVIGDVRFQSNKMTVQQCVELCRANTRSLAYVSEDVCFCEDTLSTPESGQCTATCPGQSNQICGGEGIASVYDVSSFTAFAETCDDLFNTGIFISESYVINGSLTTCTFKDGTACPYGWIGYQGYCYQHFNISESENRTAVCAGVNATLTSLTSLDELTTLEDYLQRIQFDLDQPYHVYTGITHGLYEFNVTLSQDGLLTDHIIISSGQVDIQDLYDHGHLTLHNTAEESDDGGVLCKYNKHTIGCYNTSDLNTLQPVITNYASMELALCKQTCISQNREVALMGQTECYCVNVTDLASLTPAHVTACSQPCVLMPEQTCGNGFVLWAHLVADHEVPSADNCSVLYQNGIFLNQTYKLANPERYETCGFTDTTQCPASWFGKSSKCLKMITEPARFSNSRSQCSKAGGYLFNPTDDVTNTFLQEILDQSGLFNSISHWLTGIYHVVYNTSYVTSRGQITVDYNFGPGDTPHDGVIYDGIDEMWYKRDGNIPFVCELDNDYIDCVAIHDTADSSYTIESDAGNSITMCMYWCKGQGHSFSAVTQTACKCYSVDITSYTLHPGSCTSKCSGVPSQICGHSDNKYTYVRTEHVSVIPKTCTELYIHGVFMRGYYVIDYRNQNVTVQCFTSGALSHISLNEVKTTKVSSNKTGHSLSQASLAYPYTEAWKPQENVADTWFTLATGNWYLVAGIIMAGLHSHLEQSYVQTYRVEYRDLLSGSMTVYPYNSTTDVWPGCTTSYTMCSSYPADPVVTVTITVYPETWNNEIALQFLIYGKAFSDFNHADSYLGCYLDGDVSFTAVGSGLSLEECLAACRMDSRQFAGIGDSDKCLCGLMSPDYGYLDDAHCPFNDTTSKRQGQDIQGALALYRTYGSKWLILSLMVTHVNAFANREDPDQPAPTGAV